MLHYHRLGNVPHKRHTQFRAPDGGLYREHLMGTRGFSGPYSLLYHLRHPTRVKQVDRLGAIGVDAAADQTLRHYHLKTRDLESHGDPIEGRIPLLFNDDVILSVARPNQPMEYFFRNGEKEELHFIHEGRGRFQTIFGSLPFRKGDYVVMPRGTTYRMLPEDGELRFLVFESPAPFEPPKRYRNEFGQLMEHSPYCERDIGRPDELEIFDELGQFEVRIKAHGELVSYILDHHPLDVVGWDGCLYPCTLNIEDYEPKTGRIHLPPPTHQTFQGEGFVVCSFVPRKYDYHPEAIPVPYNHSNVNSDEVLYYCNEEFMSRKGVEYGSITLHPAGIPHGPHPGVVESSLGKEETSELAVMMDTFRPLKVTKAALGFEDSDYPWSWLEED